VAQHLAQAMSALFEAERASSEPAGKASIKSTVGFLSQSLALLQEARGKHPAVESATESIAQALSLLYPLSTQPSRLPPPGPEAPSFSVPQADPVPTISAMPEEAGSDGPTGGDQHPPMARDPSESPLPVVTRSDKPASAAPPSAPTGAPPSPSQPAPVPTSADVPAPSASTATAPAAPAAVPPATGSAAAISTATPTSSQHPDHRKRQKIEVNIGATTESNFYVGFSGDISEGGVFASTYNILPKGTPVSVLITLPGGFEKEVQGYVRFVRDPMDMSSDSEPGMGIQFEGLEPDARELILRFIRKRPPMFYDE
jgi:uncharacterized protein (TIGR02266 family)